MLASERKLPVPEGAEKRLYVREMFSAIAPRYDVLNHVLSLNMDRLWRRRAVRLLGWARNPTGRYLDICAGTLDLAAELTRQPTFSGEVVGVDFALPMLERGRRKAEHIAPVNGDALALPFPAGTFDGATVGFGVRNLASLDAGLGEAARVLKSGARLVVLEFTTPRTQPLRGAYLRYFCRLLPLIGRRVSKHTDAYSYLPESVLAFPDPDGLSGRLREAGFERVAYDLLLGGICAVHVGTKP